MSHHTPVHPIRNMSHLVTTSCGIELERFSLPPDWGSTYDTVLIRIEDDRNVLVMEETIFLWKMPASIAGLLHPVTISIYSVQRGANGTAVVALSTNGLALYVVLTTRAQGRFCENAFVLKPNISRVRAIMRR